jgi:hypothetical protein
MFDDDARGASAIEARGDGRCVVFPVFSRER